MSGFLHSDRAPLARPVAATIYEGRVARTHEPGDALLYTTGPEHRDSVELQNIVGQLAGLKVYLHHPTTFPAENSGQKVVGYVESGRLDDDSAVARIVITDEEALTAIRSGTYELSLGYRCALDEKRYQRGIQLDHLAIVDSARCGASCAMRTDSENNVMKVQLELSEELKVALDQLKSSMYATEKEKCDTCGKTGEECECEEERSDEGSATCTCNNRATSYTTGETMADTNTDMAAELAATKEKLDAANAKLTALEIESTNARKDADAAKAKIEALEAEAKKAKEDAEAAVAKAKTDADDLIKTELQARVDARVALLVEAKPFLGDTDLSNMSDRDIKCAVVKHVDGDDIPADKSMDYVSGVYAGALKRGANAGSSRDAARVAIEQMRNDGAKVPLTALEREQQAKNKMQNDSATAWTK